MTGEHKRLRSIVEKTIDQVESKRSDRVIVIVANNEGLWVSATSGINKGDELIMMKNIVNEVNKINFN